MSSRALRKLQRQQDLQRQEAAVRGSQDPASDSEDDENGDQAQPSPPSRPVNAYHMLEQLEDDEGDSEPDDGSNALAHVSPLPPSGSQPVDDLSPQPDSATPVKSKRRKKKKGKSGKSNAKPTSASGTPGGKDDSGDEIDRALKELAAKDHNLPAADVDTADQVSSWEASATLLLAIDSRHLNPINEMRSLFGNIAVEGQESRPSARTPRRRQQNQQGGVDLGTALTGRYSVASKGRELGALASRRNIFVQGKEEWPLATSGGLSMDHVPAPTSFEKRYNIMHNDSYREAQMHFKMVVDMMDPQRMVALLSVYPYHIATLLQVSEIAKHQGDHAVSGDLVERALYSFGRSVHSSFPAALRSGVARVPFDKPANRDLYLAIWRYIRNLEMRGTWRTALEWSMILLQLNTQTDPFGVTLMIDQLALRARQHDKLLQLCSDDGYGDSWDFLPNIQISRALAYHRAGKPQDARSHLAVAMHKYPYVLSALASALDVSPLPKSLWARLPSTDAEKLHTQLYVTRAKDLWNTPETISLLVEVAETLSHYRNAIASAPPAPKLEISLEEARHIMLLEIPSLIAFLPRRFTTMPTSSFDVLPPPDTLTDFVTRAPGSDPSGNGPMQSIFSAAGATAGATGSLLQRIMTWFQSPAGPNDANAESEVDNEVRNLEDQLGGTMPPGMIERLLQLHLDEELADDEAGLTTAGQEIAGGWDYYEEANENVTTDDGDHESMPSLESVSPPDTGSAPNPLAATVEEGDDDDDGTSPAVNPLHGHAVLRRVESDDEAENDVPPNPVSNIPRPMMRPASPSAPTSGPEELTDPHRLQRWLLTTGLDDLQSRPDSIKDYVSRLNALGQAQRDWVVSMVKQRAGADVEAKLKAALQQQGHSASPRSHARGQ